MARNVLVLTATVTPLPGIPSLARTDSAARLNDYRAALRFYVELLGKCFDAIIFAENSSADISSLVAEMANYCGSEGIEFVSFYGLDYPPAFGRGYGEFRIVDFVVANSKLIRPDDVIWKVTGRYIIQNIQNIVQGKPKNADIYCHMRNYPHRLCELYLVAWNHRGYDRVIRGISDKLRNDIVPNKITMEEILFRGIVDKAEDQITVVPRFYKVPIVRGIRGYDNAPYSRKLSPKILARQVAHHLIPSLWI